MGFEKAKSHYVVPEQQLPGADNLTLLSFIRPVAAKQGLIIAGRLFPQHTFPPFLLLPASCSAITGTRAANITSNTQLRNYTNTQIHKYTNEQIHRQTNTQIHKYKKYTLLLLSCLPDVEPSLELEAQTTRPGKYAFSLPRQR